MESIGLLDFLLRTYKGWQSGYAARLQTLDSGSKVPSI